MRGAETSKTMLMCWRREQLHKSASFKLIPEKLQTNPKNDAKSYPKTILKSIENKFQKRCRKTSQNINENAPKFQIWAPIWEPVA